MPAEDEPDLRASLRDVEAEIARLRGEGSGLAEQLGGRDDGPQDAQDTAAAATNLEETRALLDALEARRASLLRRLGAT